MSDFLDGATRIPDNDFLAGATPIKPAQPAPAAPRFDSLTPQQAAQRQQQIEGTSEGVESAAVDPSLLAVDVVTGGLPSFAEGLAPLAGRIATKAASNLAGQEIQNLITQGVGHFTHNPYLQTLVGVGLPALLGIAHGRAARNVAPERVPPVEPAEATPETAAPTAPTVPTPQPQEAPAAPQPPPAQAEALGNQPPPRAPVTEATSELPPAPKTAPVAPQATTDAIARNRFAPALKDPKSGVIYTAEPNERTHAQVFGRLPDNIQDRDLESGFTDAQGNYLTREQAAARTYTDLTGAPVKMVKTDDLHLDPERFQHKVFVDKNTGEARKGENLDINQWDQIAAMPMMAWRDKDGKMFVVNGHQRYAAAQRLGVKELPIVIMDEGPAKADAYKGNVTAEQARANGAEINLKQNQGTALDFAKYMRDTGKTPEQISAMGIPMGREKTQNAIALSKLSPQFFKDVINQRISPERAAVIGRELGDNIPAQESLYKTLADDDFNLDDKELSKYIRLQKAAGTWIDDPNENRGAGQQMSLGGINPVQERSLAPQMAELWNYTESKLNQDKRAFGGANRNAARLEEGGSTIDREQAQAIAAGASRQKAALEAYAAQRGSATNSTLREYAEKIAKAPNRKAANALKAEAYEKVHDALERDWAGANQAQTAPIQAAPTEPIAPAEPSQAELEASGQGSMFDKAAEQATLADRLQSQRGAVTVPVPRQAVEAVQALKNYHTQIKEAFAPASLSDTAEGAAALLGKRNAELENNFTLAVDALNKSKRYMDNLPKRQLLQFWDDYENGREQPTPELRQVAQSLRILDRQRDAVRALGTGALKNFYENYLPHYWTDSQKAQELYTSPRGSLEGGKNFLKKRTYRTFADGYNAGLEPVTWNPVEQAMMKYYEMGKYIRGVQYFRDLKREGWLQFVKKGQEAPAGWKEVNDKIARVMQFSDKEKAFIQRGSYYAPQDVSRLIDRFLSPGLFKGNTSGNLFDLARLANNSMNAMELGFSAFHIPTTAANAILSDVALGMQKVSRGEVSEGVRAIARSPISFFRNAYRGRQIYRQFFGKANYGAAERQIVQNYIDSGANFDQARPFIDNWTESWQKAWKEGRAVKGIAQTPLMVAEQMASPIFKKLVPWSKVAAFADLSQEELAKLPPNARSIDRLKVLSNVQKSIDNRFGELNYDKLLWDNKFKDLAFLILRAPGWNIGDVREFGGGLLDIPKIWRQRQLTPRAAYSLATLTAVPLMGAIYQYAKTGQFPSFDRNQITGEINIGQSYYHLIAPKTGNTLPNGQPERKWLPGYMKDIAGIATHPTQTIAHKLSPILEFAYQQYENENYFHQQIRDPDASIPKQIGQTAVSAAKAFIPLTEQNREQAQGKGVVNTVESFAGLTPANREVTNTPAMNKMDEILKSRSPQGGASEQMFEHQQARRNLEDKVRAGGTIERTDLQSGQLSSSDLNRVLKSTAVPYRVARFQELSLPDALKVYGVSKSYGNVDEMRTWIPLIFAKATNAYKRGTIPPAQWPAIVQQLKAIQADRKRFAAVGD